MKKHRTKKNYKLPGESQMSELLILPDGQILVHNLTQPFAELLHELNPDDDQIIVAAVLSARQVTHPYELPN